MSRVRMTRIISCISELERLAEEIEPHNPRIALALDQVSDRLEVEAGLMQKVKEKAVEWKDKLVGFIKKNKDKVISIFTDALNKLGKKMLSVALSKTKFIIKLAKNIIARSSVNPQEKSQVLSALSGNDPVIIVKKLSGLLKKPSTEEKKEAEDIAESLQGQLKTASSEREWVAVISSAVEAGLFDKISAQNVLILTILIIHHNRPNVKALNKNIAKEKNQ